jgi:23S rRNA pseudouridine2605 synthase
MTKPAKVKMLSLDKRKKTCIIEITIHEGRNRQIRRMFDKIGYPVLKLKRERYAFLDLKGLNPGAFREITPHEVKRLRALAQHGKHARV